MLGAGFISLPELPSQDPLELVIRDPVVPERKRVCGHCDARLTRTKGFCPNCGAEYNFMPTLSVGDLLDGQFEIKGTIAYGGLGWVYLAWDQVLSRWSVLKGLLNAKDSAAAAAAVAERQFLAAVKHPKIVNIYNFITRGTEGFIVMEYVSGKSIKAIRQERGALPPAEAIAYTLGILPALGYLHRRGYVYCDFKPDNFMVEGDDVKLIDLGGVRRLDDTGGDVYGTKGYSAPEASTDPSISGDLYSVARTLAVLMFDFAFQGAYLHSLPPATEQPVLADHESLRRFLLRATADNPDLRFQSADEMADQLLGVLRDVAGKNGVVKHVESKYFLPEVLARPEQVDDPFHYELPAIRLDPNDPATNGITGLIGLPDASVQEGMKNLSRRFGGSLELQFFAVRTHLGAGRLAEAAVALKALEASDPFDWRLEWYKGELALRNKQLAEAAQRFERCMDEMPGEVVPRIARANALEIAGSTDVAAKLYENVALVEPGIVSAFFGLARCKLRAKDRSGAVDVLAKVPVSSSLHVHAQIRVAQILTDLAGSPPTEQDLARASKTLQGLKLDGYELNRLASDLFLAAIDYIQRAKAPAPNFQVLGEPFQEHRLRLGAERQLRVAAKLAGSVAEKDALIDRANSVRPWTLV